MSVTIIAAGVGACHAGQVMQSYERRADYAKKKAKFLSYFLLTLCRFGNFS